MRDIDERYVRCGAYGHAWFDVAGDWNARYGVPVTLRCERCGMERHDTIGSSTGELVTRSYDAPPGYRYVGEQRPTKDDFRLAAIRLARKEARARNAGGGGTVTPIARRRGQDR